MRVSGRVALLGAVLGLARFACPAAEAKAEASPPTAVVPAAPPSAELQRILALLAKRAELHRSLLYRFQCIEDLTRKLQRRPDSAYGGAAPEEEVHERCGIVVEKGKTGIATAVRAELDGHGKVKLNHKGEPVEAILKPKFDPVAKAVPHAQAATFTARGQEDLAFHLVSAMGKDGPEYRIRCPQGHEAVEFLDRHAPELHVVCKGQASGQMCVDPGSGEISALAFYGLLREDDQCLWDRQAPFAMVEQGLVESKTGARFPSRVRTIYSVNSRDNAIYDQRYEDCGFTNVEVEQTFGGVTADSGGR